MIICISSNKVKGIFIKYYKNFHFVIEKFKKPYIISTVIGASSNGRTRDFGSLYHGSNPCAPTKILNCSISAMSRTFFVEKTNTFCHLSLSSKVVCQIYISYPALSNFLLFSLDFQRSTLVL